MGMGFSWVSYSSGSWTRLLILAQAHKLTISSVPPLVYLIHRNARSLSSVNRHFFIYRDFGPDKISKSPSAVAGIFPQTLTQLVVYLGDGFFLFWTGHWGLLSRRDFSFHTVPPFFLFGQAFSLWDRGRYDFVVLRWLP